MHLTTDLYNFFLLVMIWLNVFNNQLYGQIFEEKLKQAESIRDSDPIESDKLLREIMEADSIEVSALAKARTLQLLGVSAMYKNQFDSAEQYFKKSQKSYQFISSTNASINQQASLVLDIGRSYTWQAKYDSALQQFLVAKRLYQETNNLQGQAESLNAIAIIYGQFSEEYGLALETFQEALSINQQLRDTLSTAKVMQNLGQIYELVEQFDSALYYLRISNALSEKYQDFRSMAVGSNIIGAVFYAIDELDSSEYYYEKAIQLDLQNQDSIGLIYDYYMLTQTLIGKKEFRKAESYGLVAFKNTKDIGVKYETARNLSLIYESLSNYYKALEYHKEYKILEDSLRSESQRSKISELQTKYETEKKEGEIALLEQENLLTNIELEAANRGKLIYLLITILIFVIALTIFYIYRQNNRSKVLLAQKNDQLSKLNATKDRLFGVIAHDIKSPLSAFTSITESLVDNHENMSGEDLKYYLNKLFKSSNQLSGLLKNLLEWSMSQTDELKFQPERLQLNKLTNAAIEPLLASAEIKNIKLDLVLNDETYVNSDGGMIRTILRNLVSNAIKFTERGGSVAVSTEQSENKVIVSVSDTGIGIDQEDQHSLFDSSFDKTSIGDSEEKGTGLGLILCKELVDKMKEQLWVDSQLGRGSKFSFTLNKGMA